jgi:hypothetical protein
MNMPINSYGSYTNSRHSYYKACFSIFSYHKTYYIYIYTMYYYILFYYCVALVVHSRGLYISSQHYFLTPMSLVWEHYHKLYDGKLRNIIIITKYEFYKCNFHYSCYGFDMVDMECTRLDLVHTKKNRETSKTTRS